MFVLRMYLDILEGHRLLSMEFHLLLNGLENTGSVNRVGTLSL